MRSAEPSQSIGGNRYLELNPEHLSLFLDALDRAFEIDRERVEELIRGTVCQGGIDGQMGVPRVRSAGRWTSTS
jgi:hypothetical protein